MDTFPLALTPETIAALVGAGFAIAQPLPTTVDLPLTKDVRDALATANFSQCVQLGVRVVPFTMADGSVRYLHERTRAELHEWLVARQCAVDLLNSAQASGDEQEIFAVAQACLVPLAALALGWDEERVWQETTAADRRAIVGAVDALCQTGVYLRLLETAEPVPA